MKKFMFERIKRLFHFVVYILLPLTGGGWVGVSCSDMLETESTRQNIDPELVAKTDSVFYGFGILQAMQELADAYVFQGELRGDLVKVNPRYADKSLQELANFTATTANKYDSAYVYYRVINNCNYYIAHRDTALYTGSTNVVKDEFIAVKAIRAWAYLQLGRNYERVPFFTEPLTQISQIDDNSFPELDLAGLVNELAPDLEQDLMRYPNYAVPTYGVTGAGHNIGSPNWESTQKSYLPRLCFIPADVVLGDMYLEVGNYDQAARHLVTYLIAAGKADLANSSPYLAALQSKTPSSGRFGGNDDSDLPDRSLFSDASYGQTDTWAGIFGRNATDDIISYIPMPVNRQYGTVTNVPLAFGFNYYATSEERSDNGETQPYVDEVQLLPSNVLNQLSDSTEYYYYYDNKTNNLYDSISIAKAGDMRLRSILHQSLVDEETKQWIDKYKYANIVLYRTSTVLLRLAEAFNRLGMPDAAFAILKDGISDNLTTMNVGTGQYYATYITDETRTKLQTTYPLLSVEPVNNAELFPKAQAYGIHCHGAGKAASDYPGTSRNGGTVYKTGASPYQLDRMVGLKMKEIANDFGFEVGATKQDSINAMEDLLCDEYALETAFEGNRYFDLMRLARHKNGHSGTEFDGSPAGYGSQFGYQWLRKKLGDKGWNESNMYLPFK